MSATMDQVREISERIEQRTGYRVYQYTSMPTPTQARIVFSDVTVTRESDALAHMLAVEAAVEAGEWQHWVCRNCPATFYAEADRDKHEREEGDDVRRSMDATLPRWAEVLRRLGE